MYATKAINGVPAIQRDGQSVLGVCEQNWDFANWLCALLNELGHKSELLLNEPDRNLAPCERSRLQKGGTACLISRQSPRFLSLFLFITRNRMSSNCMAVYKASWRSLAALTSSSLSMMAAGILLTSC